MDKVLQFETAQAIARAIVGCPEKFSANLVNHADSFVSASKLWRQESGDRWENASIGWTYLLDHKEEWEGKLGE